MWVGKKDVTFPNVLTCIRIFMSLILLYLFFVVHLERMVFILAVIASSLDYFDGWYARRYDMRTRLGVHLDPLADKVLVTSIFFIIAYVIEWKWFYAFVGLIVLREVTITYYRAMRRRRSGIFIPASWIGKIKTLVQYVVGNFLLFYLFVYPGHPPAHGFYLVLIMSLVVFITIDSGLRYLLPSCSDGRKRSFTERVARWITAIAEREV